MSDLKSWFVIINPTSGNGTAKKQWPKIRSLLNLHNFEFQFQFTKHAKHSLEIIHNTVNQGFKKFIIVGGDGTLHNVVNGIFKQKKCNPDSISVGIIPIGTGNDWIKTYGISKKPELAIQTILNNSTKTQDIGKIEFLNPKHKPIYFNNLAGIGFDGFVVSKVSKYKKLGAIAYLLASLIGLFSFSNFKAEVFINSKRIKSKVLMVVIGLCKYSGGGMRLTETPNPADGFFDISLAKDLSKFEILRALPNLFNGKIINNSKIETYKSKTIEVVTKGDVEPLVEADGELIGKGDFKISIIENSFRFYA
ncbi:MAG: diacylglycerol kinase family lipid kinase [Flavobacteriaceae bacterium]|nr:diacylglycerol kinase family lipid kinase [Bacteroidia bacterium]NNK82257.1 diacylglycerol kinase family lipid kinase [Flavobacteriaceae bacterium]